MKSKNFLTVIVGILMVSHTAFSQADEDNTLEMNKLLGEFASELVSNCKDEAKNEVLAAEIVKAYKKGEKRRKERMQSMSGEDKCKRQKTFNEKKFKGEFAGILEERQAIENEFKASTCDQMAMKVFMFRSQQTKMDAEFERRRAAGTEINPSEITQFRRDSNFTPSLPFTMNPNDSRGIKYRELRGSMFGCESEQK